MLRFSCGHLYCFEPGTGDWAPVAKFVVRLSVVAFFLCDVRDPLRRVFLAGLETATDADGNSVNLWRVFGSKPATPAVHEASDDEDCDSEIDDAGAAGAPAPAPAHGFMTSFNGFAGRL